MFRTPLRSRQDRRRRWVSGLLAASVLSSGCTLQQWVDNGFKVGPNYTRPAAPTASAFIDYQSPRVKGEESDLSEWWRVLNDPALDALIEAAYQQNLTLRVAGARILEAQGRRGVAVGNLFPQVQQALGDFTRIKTPTTTTVRVPQEWYSEWGTGFTASWELDFWGRYRRAVEAADAELDASIENYDDVLVILLAEVASNYTRLRTFQDRLRYLYANVVGQYNSYHLAVDKYILGAATERDVQQARTTLEQTRTLVPEFELGVRQANNQLCILLGMPPQSLAQLDVTVDASEFVPLKNAIAERVNQIDSIVKEFSKDRKRPEKPLPGLLEAERDASTAEILRPLQGKRRIPEAPIDLVVGVPADLLRRRPDVRRSERQVAAQSARIGIAEADFYPRISLNGTLGVSAEQLGDLFHTPDSLAGIINPSFRWDVLNYGRIVNNVRVQDARFQQLAFAYQDAVLQAGREAEDAIVGFIKSQDQRERAEASVAAAVRTLEITLEQYRLGAVDFTPIALSQSILAVQQDRLVVAQGDIVQNLIATYRALGGGWQMRLSRDAAPAPVAAPQPMPMGQGQ